MKENGHPNGSNGGMSLAMKVNAFRADLTAKKESIFVAAAEHIRPERFIELVARACIAEPKLLSCTKVSLFEASSEAARLGLEIGGVMGHAYIVPYSNRGVLEAQLVPGYKGYKELAYRSGKVSIIDAGTVRKGDRFSYLRGTDQWVKHRPADEADGEWTHCYAFGKTVHGESTVEVMSKAKVLAHRDKFAKGWNRAGSAWKEHPEAMGEKTCLHRICRRLPLATEAQQLVERSEYVERGVPISGGMLEIGDEPPADDMERLKQELDAEEPDESGYAGEPTEEEMRAAGLLNA